MAVEKCTMGRVVGKVELVNHVDAIAAQVGALHRKKFAR